MLYLAAWVRWVFDILEIWPFTGLLVGSLLLMIIEWLMKWHCIFNFLLWNESEFHPKYWIQLNCNSSTFNCSFVYYAQCTLIFLLDHSKYFRFSILATFAVSVHIQLNWFWNWIDKFDIVCARFILNRFCIHWIKTFFRYCWNVKTLIPNSVTVPGTQNKVFCFLRLYWKGK